LLVLGSTHRGPIGQVFPGTVAERLLSDAPCPLAIAPRGYADRSHGGVGLIGVGYDGSRNARAALEMAKELARAAGDELRIIGIAPGYAGVELPPPLEPLRQETTRRVERALDAVSDDVAASTVVGSGDPAAYLEQAGVELDLLVIGSRGRGPIKDLLLGSVSADVMQRAPCPVVVVPALDA
jgi:nucleotide-binding universal stress UspA family protein